MKAFSEVLAELAAGGTVSVGDDWTQGRTLFGGLSAALAAADGTRAAGEGQQTPPPLRSAQFAFIGPAAGPVTVSSTVLRRGRSAVFVQSDLMTEQGLALRGILTFGSARPSAMAHQDHPPPPARPIAGCPSLHGPGGGPGFAAHFDVRPADGEIWFGRNPDGTVERKAGKPDLILWARHRDPAAGLDPIALLALGDIPPPAAMRLMAAPAPISTMTWMVDFLTPPTPAPAEDDGWRLLRSTAEVVTQGYCSQSMSLWDSAGRPLMAGRQNVAVFG
ncbi:hypothetical protein QO010_003643 [Caulobacter ginsengisoli]|uniref:Acyl-CoA thioesterase n=1 Tax=Caulobacter ginsengisoli TaxID=400775 RepID=A0ABU0IUZ8_9CAUL|nr:thioesterase family protein [Caulobacter ginsengisoli]MDQ0465851.1 hypothetical protein [Caulobacter ginsengisoli]